MKFWKSTVKHSYLSVHKTSTGKEGCEIVHNFFYNYSYIWCGGLQSWSWSKSRSRHLYYPEPGQNETAPQYWYRVKMVWKHLSEMESVVLNNKVLLFLQQNRRCCLKSVYTNLPFVCMNMQNGLTITVYKYY